MSVAPVATVIASAILDAVTGMGLQALSTRVRERQILHKVQRAAEDSLKYTGKTFPWLHEELVDQRFLQRAAVRRELGKFLHPIHSPDTIVLAEEWVDCFGKPIQGDPHLVMTCFVSKLEHFLLEIDDLQPILINKRRDRLLRSISRDIKAVRVQQSIEKAALVSSMVRPDPDEPESIPPAEATYDAKMDLCRGLITEGKPQAAWSQLIKLEQSLTAKQVSNRLRFRLHTNLGACALALGDRGKALDSFSRASRLQPNEPKAHANLALVHYFQGNPQEAVDLAEEVLEKQEYGTIARAVRTRALAQLRDYQDLDDLVEQEHLGDTDYVRALGTVFLIAMQHREAEKYLRICLAQNEGDIGCLLLLAQAIASTHLPRVEASLFTSQIRNKDWEVAREQALDAAEKAVRKAREGDNTALLHDALTARAGVRGSFGDVSGANKDCDEVLEENPKHEMAIQNRALGAFDQGEFEQALKLFERLPADCRTHHSVCFALAKCYVETHRAEKAIELLDTAEGTQGDSENLNYVILRAEAFIEQGDRGKATALKMKMLRQRGRHPATLEAAALIDYLLGDRSSELKAIREAFDLASGSEQQRIAVRIAMLHYSQRQFDKACSWFERVREAIRTQPDLVRAYINCLYATRQLMEASVLAREVREKGMLVPAVLNMEASIADNLGDLVLASELYTKLRELEPETRAHAINLARVEARRGRRDAAQGILTALEPDQISDPIELAQLARLYDYFDEPQRAISLAYRAVRIGCDSPQPYLLYISLFLHREHQIEGLQPTEVGQDTAVRLRSDSTQHWAKILHRGLPQNAWEFSTDSEAARTLMGHHVGDTVTFGSGMLDQTEYTVVEIQSILVRTLQETLEEFRTRFPSDPAIQKVQVEDGNVTPLLAHLAGLSSRASLPLDFYDKGLLPIETLAEVLGRSQIEVQLGLAGLKGYRILCSEASPEAQDRAVEALEKSDSVSLGLSALVTLSLLDVLETLPRRFETIIAPQQLVDLLESELARAKLWTGRGRHQLSYEEGTWHLTEVPPDAIRREVSWFETMLNFVRESCTIVPVDTEYARPMLDGRSPLRSIGPVSLATLLVAKQTETPLCTDDLVLRTLAEREYSLRTSWSLAMLHDLHAKGGITREQYEAGWIKLIAAHYYYVPINTDILLNALRDRSYQLDAELRKALRVLRGPYTSQHTAIVVASRLLRRIWLDRAAVLNRDSILYALLAVLVEGRVPARVIHELKAAVSRELYLAPLHLPDLLEAIEGWRRLVGPTITPETLRSLL